MVKCKLCGKPIEFIGIETIEVDEEDAETDPYISGIRYDNESCNNVRKKVKVPTRMYGCSDHKCLSLKMTEKEHREEQEWENRGR